MSEYGIDATEAVMEIAQRHLQGIKKTGPENIMAFCPFHDNSNTPSFTLSLTRGLFFCFSCKAAGNLEMFLERLEVPRLVIEKRYGVVLGELNKYQAKKQDPLRPNVLSNAPLPESLLGLFEFVPVDLEHEGFSEEVLHEFEVGVDLSHKRITFPLRDWKGNLVGISGRSLLDDDWGGRYKIYDKEFVDFGLPARSTLDKRSMVWNYHRVFPVVFPQRGAQVIVVEGFKSVMWLAQHGFPHTVALLGSFLSEEQKWLLEHLGASLYVMFDNDAAGQKGLDILVHKLAKSVDLHIVEYDSDCAQPTDIPGEDLGEILGESVEYFNWCVQRRMI